MRNESCDGVSLRSMEFKDVVVQVFYRLSAQRSFLAQYAHVLHICNRSYNFASLHSYASLCQSGAVAFITIPLHRIYLESQTQRTMHFSPALAKFPDINPTMIYPNF
ncbi:hypothetical protein P692DRAFT_20830637, partial [Suillus brevipes Sb2]